MRVATVLSTIASLVILASLSASGFASAADYGDVQGPTSAQFTFTPDRGVRGVASQVDVTLVVVDDKSPTRVISAALLACEGPTSMVARGFQLLERRVDPSTGSVEDTWVGVMEVPAEAWAGEYQAIVNTADELNNRRLFMWQGVGCEMPGREVLPDPVFIVDPPGASNPDPVSPVSNRLVALQAEVDRLSAENSKAARQLNAAKTKLKTLDEKYKKALALIEKLQRGS
jgi:hypothetical protein